jgi:hypothetical protein
MGVARKGIKEREKERKRRVREKGRAPAEACLISKHRTSAKWYGT